MALNAEEVLKDVVLQAGARAPLALAQHVAYLQRWGRDADEYEFAVSE